jgi:uncharacterized protein HemX
MAALILWIGRATGLSSLLSAVIAYAVIAALAGGALWGYGHHKYSQGYDAGASHERIAWEEQRKRDLAKQAQKIAQDQAKIDQIEAENAALESQLANTQEALEAAIHADGADQKPAMSKGVAKALNSVGRE